MLNLTKHIKVSKQNLYIFLYMVLLCLLVSCKPKSLTEDALSSYVKEPENGLSQSYENGQHKVVATIRPTDLVIKQLVESPTVKVIDSLQKFYANYWYFNVGFSTSKQDMLNVLQVQNYQKFSDVLQTVSFRMSEYAYLTTSNKDTIPLADFSYMRLYGMSRSTDVLMVFENKKAKNTAKHTDWVQLNINEFGAEIGDIRLRFKTNDINNIPKLQFKQ